MSRPYEPLVLCLHAVSATWPHDLSLEPATLDRHLEGLVRRGYAPATAEEVCAGRGRRLHVTFDDAYVSVRSALPTLERLSLKATVFACPGVADTAGPLVVPELARDLEAWPDELQTMGWDELRDLAERGHEIGSHTVTHPHLPQLGDAELDRELGESRQRLEDALRKPCRYLAYPYGDQDERVQRAARRAGYAAAFALPGDEHRWNPFAIPRVGLYRGDSSLKARLKTTPRARRAAARALRLAGRRP